MLVGTAIYLLIGLVMAAICYRDQPMPGFLVAVILLGPFILLGYIAKEIVVRARPDASWERH